ncbi:MAG: sigma factor [Sedimentisphaerales bacterium]
MAKENSKPQPDPLVILAATDSSAFILLYDIYYEKIYRYCAGRLRSKQVIEDLTSMIFIRAARNISRFTGTTRTEFFDWLYAIATEEINRCLKKEEFAKLAIKTEQEPIETPDASHKEKLRAKIFSVFNIGRTEISRLILYSIVAAAVFVIAAFLFFQSAPANRPALPKKITRPNETNLPQKVKPITLIPAPSKEANTSRPAAPASEETNEPLTIKIGGIVKNQQSEPIKAAAVRVLVKFSDNEDKQNISLLGTFKTDANGIWRCDNFPLNATGVSIMATHPDYLPAENYQMASIEQLEDFSSVTVLEKGITVTGRVIDSQQRPLRATITKGSLPSDSNTIVTCDANGWFHFDNVPQGVEVFIARYGGGAPQMQPVEIKPDMPPVIFTLELPNVIRGKVADVSGDPVKDASVAVSSWQGTNSLSFETKTDADGFFQWTNAPADEVSFDIQKNDYMSIRNYAMKSGSDYVITLRPAFKFHGIVTSSDPNIKVDTFKIFIGYYYPNSNISWQKTGTSFSNGKYEMMITEPLDFQLRVQADALESVDSPVFNPSQNAAEYNFILVPTKTTP